MDLTLEEVTVLHAQIGAEVINSALNTGGRARLVVRNSHFDGGSPPTMLTSVFAVTDVDALIEGNVVRRIQTFGCIQAQQGANADVMGNDVDECGLANGGLAAIAMSPGTVVNMIGNTVRNSTASDSRFGIVWSGSATGRVERNTVLDYVQPGATPIPAGIGVFGTANPTVQFNDIAGNAQAGLRKLPGVLIDATCNWWGSADGPSGDGPGSGDAVFGPVTFIPFATEPIAGTNETCGAPANINAPPVVPGAIASPSAVADSEDPFPLRAIE